MSNILISLGSIIRQKNLLKYIENNNNTFFLVENKHKYLYRTIFEKQKIYFEKEILQEKNAKLEESINLDKIYEITNEILKDQNSQFILSRRKLSYYEYSPMRLYDLAVNLINHSLRIIKQNKLEYLVIHNTPHSENWFLFRTAELMGKKVFIIRESLIPGYSNLYFGLKDQNIVNWNKNNVNVPRIIINNFINDKRKKTYSFPKLQEDRKNMYKNGYSGFTSETKFFLKEDSFNINRTIKAKLAVIKTVLFKKDSLDFYQKNTLIKHKYMLKKYAPYIIYFLQYQPERTSIPEANFFSYQYRTILYLRRLLPKNMCLLIKEHPDSFRNKYSPRFKSVQSYENILNIPGVIFCSMDIDPFSLIDNSLAVSTLTGNVGIESICRGKKIIYFGNPIYKDYPFAINGLDIQSVNQSNELLKNNKKVSKENIRDYFIRHLNKSYKNNFENYSTNLLNDLINNIEYLSNHL